MTKALFKDAVGIVMVFDVFDSNSFDNLQKKWIPQVRAFAQLNVPIIIVANKTNEPNNRDIPRQVLMEDGFALAQEYSFNYVEVSAETNYNVDVAFRRIIFSVVDMLPDIKDLIDSYSLPLGWIQLANTSDDNEQFSNLWTGEIVFFRPVEAALMYANGDGSMDNFVKMDLVFRESFR